jgi:hypothetical protein
MLQTTNLLNGRGLTSIVNETESPDLDFATSRYNPPGFALAIAGISSLGVSVENAAIWFSRLSWALLPIALLFAMRPILPFAWAAAVTVLVITSPGIYLYGSTINTDVPTLLLLVLATGLMIRGVAEQPRVAFLLAAGLIMGLAYALRNSVTAVFVGVLASFIGISLLRQMPISSAMRNCSWIFLGSAPFIGLLMLRNYLVFGEVQPYVLMVGTDATLLDSFRVYLHGLLWDFTGSPTLARHLAWDFKALVLTATPIAALLAWGLYRHWGNAGLSARFTTLFGLMFSGAGAAMLVIAHTYHGLDFGFLLRHMMQYVWILFALMVVALLAIGNRKTKLIAGLLLAVLLASRLWFIVDDLRTERTMQVAFSENGNVVEAAQPFLTNGRILTDQIKQRLAKDSAIPAAVRALPGNALILSNQGPLLGYLSGRPVRMLPFSSENDLPGVTGRVNQVFRDMRRHRPVYIVLVPDNRVVRSTHAANWQNKIISRLPRDYRVVGKSANLLVFHVPPPSNVVEPRS